MRPQATEATRSVIVQGPDLAKLRAAVHDVGGTITHELGVIRALAVSLTPEQQDSLALQPGVGRMFENRAVANDKKKDDEVDGIDGPETSHVRLVGADWLHDRGITGAGVTIAVLDTGLYGKGQLKKDRNKAKRWLANYDAIGDEELPTKGNNDGSGHGTHVAGIAVDSRTSNKEDGISRGIAPDAGLVSVKAFDADG
ncbi:MAG: S8 family serine peptidase, partial [Thiohalocapsa sp.]